MKPETAEKVLKILNHPATQMAEAGWLGSGIGEFAGSLMYADQYEKMQKLMDEKKSQVSPEKYVAKHTPDIKIISTKKDVDESKLNFLNKFFLKLQMPEEGEKWDNAFYIPNKEHSAVVVPEKVNKYILGHELGHHKDLAGTNGPMFSSGLMGALTGRTVDVERNAWEKSPIKIDEKGQEIKDVALGSYENMQKYMRLGFGLGLVAGAAKAFGPKVLDMIRGNIR